MDEFFLYTGRWTNFTGGAYKKQGLYVAVYGMPVIGREIYALLCSGESTQVLLNWHGS